jgi:hypothetical protein
MKRPSQLYRNLKLWHVGLGVVHRAILIIIALAGVAGPLVAVHYEPQMFAPFNIALH